MRVLFLSFYFEPDLCAGSFRNTSLFKALLNKVSITDYIHVVTTMPNRYNSYKVEVQSCNIGVNYKIDRVCLPEHKNGFIDQIRAFGSFYLKVLKIVKDEQFDLVYASSSRLFTAFLGKRIAIAKKCPLYLDIRDIFVDTMKDVFKNKRSLQLPIVAFTKIVEKYTFSNAAHINLVSEGFKGYFSKYRHPNYTYFTNGIDEVFLSVNMYEMREKYEPMIITYAGNMGSGQGLEKIVPIMAKKLGNSYQFRLIGDGGTRYILQQKLEEMKIMNVELLSPVSRAELINYYNQSTFLFLHLNDLEAFEKVLPSKLFEYGAFNIPIIAGVGGFAARFIKENLSNYILFKPTDINDFLNQMRNYKLSFEERVDFKKKYSRTAIMQKMADSILAMV